MEIAIQLLEYLEKRIRPESHFELEADLEFDPGNALFCSFISFLYYILFHYFYIW